MTAPRIGTRGSQLALWQARRVEDLVRRHTGVTCELVIIKTSGDRLAEATLSEFGGKRLFVKEIEDALLAGSIDLAVHSAKDLPALLPDGLTVGAVLEREDPRDAVVLPARAGASIRALGDIPAIFGADVCIGTSSVRRVAQLRRLLTGARFLPIRGNLDTRLRKVDSGEYDLLILAAAGLRRLGFADRITLTIPPEACVPAPGQGIIAVEMRSGDDRVGRIIEAVNDRSAGAALDAERTLVAVLGGGCQVPIGALATYVDGELELQAVVTSLDGSIVMRSSARGPLSDPQALGRGVAQELQGQGAAALLEEIRRVKTPVEGLQP
ncbi:MAG: hydroxymethylbilane synthase [Acidobacteria bacterium]|nr:hydroxymethylbilane synthase [Acidobacteriota bacterium]